MARRGRKCVVADCPKVAAVGSVVCQEHRDTTLGEQTDREIMKMTRRLEAMATYEEGEERREATREFRRQVMRGDYATLFSTEMVSRFTEEGRGYDLKPEIGMMRVAMLRLMLEEENPSRMAHSLARLSGALGKAMERQGMWEREAAHRRNVREYLQSVEGPKPEVPVFETRGRVAPMDAEGGMERDVSVEARSAVIETVGKALGGAEAVEEREVSGSDWPRAGYPDYYMDVEELKKWGE